MDEGWGREDEYGGGSDEWDIREAMCFAGRCSWVCSIAFARGLGENGVEVVRT